MQIFERHDSLILCRQFVVVLVDLAKQSGVAPDKLLKGTRCFYQDLYKPNFCISTNELLTIIDNCRRLTKRQDLSFIVGRKYFPDQLGPLAQAFLNCRNLSHMLVLCQTFQFQICPFLYMDVVKANGKVHLLFNSAIGEMSDDQTKFLFEFVLSAMLGAIKYRLGEVPAVSIKLPYQEVEYIEQYHVHVSNKISFQQQLAMVSFDDCWLTRTINDCSHSLKSMALIDARQIRKNDHPVGLVQAVGQFIVKRLTYQDVSLERCAEFLGISTATLKRKLAQHNTSYQLILDKMRCQHAIFAMTEKQKNNEYIANSLHFNDVTNFRRAFKRWTGMTPTAFREKAIYS